MRPRSENAFCEPGERRLGLIDWEQALGGDPVLDIVKAEGRFLGCPDIPECERLCEALWEVPGACRGVAGRVRPAPERVSGRDVPRGGGGVRGVGAPGERTRRGTGGVGALGIRGATGPGVGESEGWW